MTKTLEAVLPFRSADAHRLSNLRAVLCHIRLLLPAIKITVVEQATVPTSESLLNEVTAQHITFEDDGPFNKSKLINIGVSNVAADIVLVCDADMILSKESLFRSIDAVSTQVDFVRPFSSLIDLDEQQTSVYNTTGSLPSEPKDDESNDRSHLNERLCLAGGAFLIRKSIFDKVSGFDERFLGWGGEDDAFSMKVRNETNRAVIARDSLAWHLWHPRAEVANSTNYQENHKLVIETRRELRRAGEVAGTHDIKS